MILARRCISVGILFLAACGGGSAKSSPTTTAVPTHNLAGTVTLRGHNVLTLNGDGSDCGTPIGLGYPFADSVPSRYDTWKTGAPIVVRDEHDTIVASGSLQTGTATKAPSDLVDQAQFDCTFAFSVGRIVGAPTFYGITIGSGDAITYSREQVTAAHWHLAIEATP